MGTKRRPNGVEILGINGSPRPGGNTSILLDKAEEAVKSVDGASFKKVILNELDIRPCQECGGCSETGVCVIKDDMTWLYRDLIKMGGVIIASPIFFGSVSAQTKMMIDRMQALWVAKYVLKKDLFGKRRRPGAFLCAGGFKKDKFFKNAREIIKIVFSVLDVDYKGELFCGGVDEKAPVLKKKTCLDKAFEVGLKIAKNG